MPGRKRSKAQIRARPSSTQRRGSHGAGEWVEHAASLKNDVALDEWGVATRALRKIRVLPEQDRSF